MDNLLSRLLVSDAEIAKKTGGCLMLQVAMDDRDKLAVPGGEPPEDLHVTLLYFGETVEGPQPTEVLSAMDQVARSYPVIEAKVFSHATFNPDGDDPCYVYLLGNSHDLADLRADLVGAIDPALTGEQHEPWIPHITGIYQEHMLMSDHHDTDDLSIPSPLSYTGPVRLDSLYLSWGQEETIIPLL